MDTNQKLKWTTKLIYGVGDVGNATVNSAILFFLMIFYTDGALIAPALAANALLVAKIWDAVNDPLFGWLSDRTRSRFGKRRVYMIFGALPLAFQATYEATLFQLEIVLGVVLPIVLLGSPARRIRPKILYGAAVLVVCGFILNRLNVSITGFEAAQGGHYVPAWAEIFITLMMVALVFGAFAFGARYLGVYPELKKARPAAPPAPRVASTTPTWQSRLPPVETVRRT